MTESEHLKIVVENNLGLDTSMDDETSDEDVELMSTHQPATSDVMTIGPDEDFNVPVLRRTSIVPMLRIMLTTRLARAPLNLVDKIVSIIVKEKSNGRLDL
jgi:hypothetical protein